MPTKQEYFKKLKDPRWQKKRLEIFERDGWTCQNCSTSEETLHIHHRYYLKNKDPWDYPNDALVTLCENCHDFEKECMQELINDLNIILKKLFLANDILDIVQGFYCMKLNDLHPAFACALSWWLKHDVNRDILVDTYLDALLVAAKKRENK